MPRFASRLDLAADVERRAAELVERGYDENLVAGRNPGGFAAACLYTAARERGRHVTQEEAAEVADVTAVTLRSAYYDLTD